MNRLILVTGMILLARISVSAQQEVRWYSLEEAIETTVKEPRILVIDVYTDWCGWCKRMDATTFADTGIAAALNEHFYPVKLNAEGKGDISIGGRTYKYVDNGGRGYHEVAAIVTRGRLAYPTISFVDEQGRVLEVSPGYKTAEQLRIYLEYFASREYREKTFEQFVDAYTGDLNGDY